MTECSLFSKDRPAVLKSLPPPLVLKYHINTVSITKIVQEYLQSTSSRIERKLNSWITPKLIVQILNTLKVICGNKMPNRCNRGIYFRSYCLLNMFRATLCPSSGAQECCTVVDACGISWCGFQAAGLVQSWGLCVRFAGCWLVTVNQWLTHYSTNWLVAGLIPTVFIGIFQWNNDSFGTIALGSTYPVTEMSTRCVSWG